MKRDSWPVTEADIRPVVSRVRCAFCKSMIGQQHEVDCVRRRRTVIIRATIDMIHKVPESWDVDNIEFFLNGSSWCASNIIADLDNLFGGDNHCLCSDFQGAYVREATEEDEAHYNMSIQTQEPLQGWRDILTGQPKALLDLIEQNSNPSDATQRVIQHTPATEWLVLVRKLVDLLDRECAHDEDL